MCELGRYRNILPYQSRMAELGSRVSCAVCHQTKNGLLPSLLFMDC